MKKIIFLVSDLTYGGTQKTIIKLVKRFVKDGYFITILTFEKKKNYNFSNKKIEYIPLNLLKDSNNLVSSLIENFKRIIFVRKILKKKSGNLICFLTSTNIIGLISNLFLKKKVILCERNDIQKQPVAFLWRFLRVLLYRFANKITCNSSRSSNYLKNYVPEKKIFYVRNHIDIKKNLVTFPKKIILSVGRMHNQKGFDILINGFKKSNTYKFGWKLFLVGDGYEKKNLIKLVKKLNLNKYIKFYNFSNPYKWYKKAGIFALTSRYEGMPNVILEASSLKLPIIISRDTGGATDFIINNKSGIVLKKNSYDELGKKISELTKDKYLRLKLGNQAYKNLKYYNNFENIYKNWEKIIIK